MEAEWDVHDCLEMVGGIDGLFSVICHDARLKNATSFIPKKSYWAPRWLSYCVIKIKGSTKVLSDVALCCHNLFLICWGRSWQGSNYHEWSFYHRADGV